jgi:hypothetical protein
VIENRQSARHDVDVACTLTVGDKVHQTQIKNLSVGGALVVHERLAAAVRVKLSFRVPTLETAIEVSGTVRWSGGGNIGVQFDGLRAREVWSLNKYFESLAR